MARCAVRRPALSCPRRAGCSNIPLANNGKAPAGTAPRNVPTKAPEDWRTPRRSAHSVVIGQRASVLECGGPPPLFHRARNTPANSNTLSPAVPPKIVLLRDTVGTLWHHFKALSLLPSQNRLGTFASRARTFAGSARTGEGPAPTFAGSTRTGESSAGISAFPAWTFAGRAGKSAGSPPTFASRGQTGESRRLTGEGSGRGGERHWPNIFSGGATRLNRLPNLIFGQPCPAGGSTNLL